MGRHAIQRSGEALPDFCHGRPRPHDCPFYPGAGGVAVIERGRSFRLTPDFLRRIVRIRTTDPTGQTVGEGQVRYRIDRGMWIPEFGEPHAVEDATVARIGACLGPIIATITEGNSGDMVAAQGPTVGCAAIRKPIECQEPIQWD